MVTNWSGQYKKIQYSFSSFSIKEFGIDLVLSKQNSGTVKTVRHIDIGRSLEYLTLNSVVHFYDVTSSAGIGIGLDGVQWNLLLRNSMEAGVVKQSLQNPKFKTAVTQSGQPIIVICIKWEPPKVDSIFPLEGCLKLLLEEGFDPETTDA